MHAVDERRACGERWTRDSVSIVSRREHHLTLGLASERCRLQRQGREERRHPRIGTDGWKQLDLNRHMCCLSLVSLGGNILRFTCVPDREKQAAAP